MAEIISNPTDKLFTKNNDVTKEYTIDGLGALINHQLVNSLNSLELGQSMHYAGKLYTRTR